MTSRDERLLLGHVLQRDAAWIVAHDDAVLSAEQAKALEALRERRRRGEPIAYLVGSAGFYRREFLVNRDVLVPRPETEHLIDEALAFVSGPMQVLDVGTGSGAVACTIAAESDAFVHATDVSAAAIATATENARRLGVGERCRFHLGDLLQPVRNHRFDVVIANLPYIPTADLPQPPDPTSFEPREALDGGPDGLTHYRNLLRQLPLLLKPQSLVLLECAPPTFESLKTLVCNSLPKFVIEGGVDYAGLPRYVKASSAGAGYVPVSGV